MQQLGRTLLFFLLLLAHLPALAQYSIEKVVFRNAGPYTETELLATSGLEAGQFLAQSSLVNAAQDLLNTGLFSDAEVYLSGEGKARTVHVDLKPIPLDKLLPASFENFVWFTPAELAQGIHARVPLYRGVASDAGNLPDAIQAALQQMLAAKGITATLSHTIVEPTSAHPVLAVDFKVEQPSVVLVKATLTGVPDALQADTLRALERAKGSAFNEGLTGATFEDIALTPARNEGYLDAKLDDIQRSAESVPGGVDIVYTANFIAGDPYKVSALSWDPTPVYPTADFARDTRLHTGDLASASGLAYTEAKITNAYRTQGYIDVYVLASPITDTTAHTVAYTLHAVPGEPYHLRAVNVVGLSTEARSAFDADWPMKPGDLYSDLAVAAYLRKHAAQPLFRVYTASFGAVGDPQTHLVDLTLTFTPNGSAAY